MQNCIDSVHRNSHGAEQGYDACSTAAPDVANGRNVAVFDEFEPLPRLPAAI